jgi:type I restriction enzyme S subunit
MRFQPYPRYKPSGIEWLGAVPVHWEIRRLRHFASFSGGGTPSRDNLAFWNGNIPWVSPKDMKTEVISVTEESITQEALEGSAALLRPQGELLMVVRSGILKHTIPVAINSVPVALNQDMRALHFDPKVCAPKFMLRWVQGLNDHLLLEWCKQGATVESIEHSYLVDTSVPLPPLDEQISITRFLDHETSKIDALAQEQQRLIDLLKEKRQAFIMQAVTKGLDTSVPMKPSGIEWVGDVPAHWDVSTVGHRYDVQLGKMLDTARVTGEHLRPYLRVYDCPSSDNLRQLGA